MRKLGYLSLSALILCLLLLWILPAFIDVDGYVKRYVSHLKEQSSLMVDVQGEATLHFLPRPTLILHDTVLSQDDGSNLHIDKLLLYISFNALISKDFNVSGVTLHQPVFTLRMESQERLIDVVALTERVKETLSHIKKMPSKVTLEQGEFHFRGRSNHYFLEGINGAMRYDHSTESLSGNGSFAKKGEVLRFEAVDIFSLTAENKLTLSGKHLNAKLSGQLDKKTSLFTFLLEGEISNMRQLAQSFLADTVLSHITAEDALRFKGGAEISEDGVRMDSIAFESEAFVAEFSLSELSKPDSDGLAKISAEAHIKKLDWDYLIAKEEGETSPVEIDYFLPQERYISLHDIRVHIPPTLHALTEITIDELTYKGKKISHIIGLIDVFGSVLHIEQLDAELPGGGKLNISGDLTNNGTRSQLKGNVSAVGDSFYEIVEWFWPQIDFIPKDTLGNYLLQAQFTLEPQSVNIEQASLSVDNALIEGDVTIHPSSTVPIVRANLSAEKIDFDHYQIPKTLYQNVVAFFDGLPKYNLDASPLKLFNQELDLTLDIHDATYNGRPLNKVHSVILARPAVINFQDLVIEGEGMSATGGALVNLTKLTPRFNVALRFKTLDTGFYLPLSEEDGAAEKEETTSWQWSEEPIKTYGLGRFRGSIVFVADQVKHGALQLAPFTLRADLARRIVNLTEYETYLGTGRIQAKGQFAVGEQPGLTLAFTMSEIDIAELDALLPTSIGYEGVASLSGTLQGFGDSPKALIDALVSEVTFSARDVRIPGIDMQKMVTETPRLFSTIDMQRMIEQLRETGETRLSLVGGTLKTERSILTTNDVNYGIPNAQGAFAGNLSLQNFELKAISTLLFLPEPGKQVTLTFNIEGPFTDVNKTVNTRQLEDYITGKASE